jgi:hypothetical protein
MVNPQGKKGYEGEVPVVEYLKRRGFRNAYRRNKQGSNDKGDVGNIEGVCIEIKNVARYDIPGWMKETAVEKKRAGARTAAMVMKPKGVGSLRVREWWAVLTLEDYVQLLIDAGYGPHEEAQDDAPPQEPRSR